MFERWIIADITQKLLSLKSAFPHSENFVADVTHPREPFAIGGRVHGEIVDQYEMMRVY
jgi:hypothetical protein